MCRMYIENQYKLSRVLVWWDLGHAENWDTPRLFPCSFSSSYRGWVTCVPWRTDSWSILTRRCLFLCHLREVPVTHSNPSACPTVFPKETRWQHAGAPRQLCGHAHCRTIKSGGEAAGRHPGLEPGHFLLGLWGGQGGRKRGRERGWLWVWGRGRARLMQCWLPAGSNSLMHLNELNYMNRRIMPEFILSKT